MPQMLTGNTAAGELLMLGKNCRGGSPVATSGEGLFELAHYLDKSIFDLDALINSEHGTGSVHRPWQL